jgi:Flp pilus assembly protein TadG
MVTLELAMAIPVLLIMCVSMVWVVNLGRVGALAQDASRAAVRELVRGGDSGQATAAAHRVLPDSSVSTSVSGMHAQATVTMELRGPAPLLNRMSHRIQALSVGSMEVP